MPSVPTIDLLTRPLIPNLTSFNGGSCSHRLKKRLEKADRREFDLSLSTVYSIYEVEKLGSSLLSVTESSYFPLMDINSPLDMSVSEDDKTFHVLNCGVTEDVFLSDLGDGLAEFLHIEDGKTTSNSTLVSSSGENDISNVEREDTWEEPSKTELTVATSDECLCKCATFPSSEETNSAESVDTKEGMTGDVLKEKGTLIKEEEEEDHLDEVTTDVLKENGYVSNKAVYHPTPLPTAVKLVSAMKGSREKHSSSAKKLTVTWAPDVYDPLPTAASHVPTNKKQRHRSDNRKNGKNKQKGKRGKDKKQVRKHGGSSNKCFQTLHSEDRVVEHHEPFADLGGFDIGSPDSYCGSSFLKSSVTKMHFSVAEAT